DLSSGAVADSVRPHVWDFCSLKDALPAPRVGGLGHWSLCFEDRGHDVGRAFQARCVHKKRDDVLTHGLRDFSGLAVWPDDTTICEVDPVPFHAGDLRHARRKGELQTDPEGEERVLQPLHVCAFEIAKQSDHFVVGDQPRLAILGVLRDVTARIGAVVPQTPDLGHVEHLAQTGQNAIGGHRRLLHSGDEARHIRPGNLTNLEGAESGNYVAVDVASVAFNSSWSMLRFRVVFYELRAEVLYARGVAGGRFLRARIFALPHVSKPILSDRACLLDCELAEPADRGLPALSGIGPILDHEDLSASGRYLQKKPRHDSVAQLVFLRAEGGCADDALCELDLGHSRRSVPCRFPGAN